MIAGTVAADLLAGSAAPWSRLAAHPFIAQAGDGSLGRGSFDRWLVADHFFVVGFRRLLTGLVTLAPDEHAADALATGLGTLQAELDLFRREAAARGLDLDTEPGPIALGYTAFLRASLQDGYPVALAVLYGAEKAYFDAWSAVRATARRDSEYWPFVDSWSSPAFAHGVASIAGLLDAIAPDGPTAAMRASFDRVVRFELRFWSAAQCTPATRGDGAGAGGRPLGGRRKAPAGVRGADRCQRSRPPGDHGGCHLTAPDRPDRDHGESRPRSSTP